jgi:heat shock protein HslJ
VEATLEFPETGKASGRASCNRFFGTVEISGLIGPLAATKMSCGAAADAQERKYLEALSGRGELRLRRPGTSDLLPGDGKAPAFARR